jgi:hypothetical protein
MYRTIWIVIIMASMFLACGKDRAKSQSVEPQGTVIIEERFFPLPEFADIFASFDHLPQSNFDKVIPDVFLLDIPCVYLSSFYLGVLTADAIVAIKARNKSKLTSIAHAMITYSQMIGIDDEMLIFTYEMLEMVKNDKWDEMLITLDKNKHDIEYSLYSSQQFDLLALVQAGGWTKGIQHITHLLVENYQLEASKVLNQKGIVNNLRNNIAKTTNPDIVNNDWYAELKDTYDQIHGIVNVLGKETFTKEEAGQLNVATRSIITQMKDKSNCGCV